MAALTRCVTKGNRSWERERDSIEAVAAINASLAAHGEVGDDEAADSSTAALLARRSAGLPALLWSDDPRGRRMYRSELASARIEKGSDLTREELELLVFIVNKVGAVNDALSRHGRHSDGAERLLATMREPELNFDAVTADAIDDYASRLIAESADADGRWLTHREIARCLVQVNRTRRQQQQQQQQRAVNDAEQREARQLRAIRELNARLRVAVSADESVDQSEVGSVDLDHNGEDSSTSALHACLAAALQVDSIEPEAAELCLALLRELAARLLPERDLWLQDLQECRREAGRLLGDARDIVDCLWRLEATLAAGAAAAAADDNNASEDNDRHGDAGATVAVLAD